MTFQYNFEKICKRLIKLDMVFYKFKVCWKIRYKNFAYEFNF